MWGLCVVWAGSVLRCWKGVVRASCLRLLWCGRRPLSRPRLAQCVPLWCQCAGPAASATPVGRACAPSVGADVGWPYALALQQPRCLHIETSTGTGPKIRHQARLPWRQCMWGGRQRPCTLPWRQCTGGGRHRPYTSPAATLCVPLPSQQSFSEGCNWLEAPHLFLFGCTTLDCQIIKNWRRCSRHTQEAVCCVPGIHVAHPCAPIHACPCRTPLCPRLCVQARPSRCPKLGPPYWARRCALRWSVGAARPWAVCPSWVLWSAGAESQWLHAWLS